MTIPEAIETELSIEFDLQNYILDPIEFSQDNQDKLNQIKTWEIPDRKTDEITSTKISIVEDKALENNHIFYDEEDNYIFFAKSFFEENSVEEIKSIVVEAVSNSSTLLSTPENSPLISLNKGLESINREANSHTLICECGSCFIPYVEQSQEKESAILSNQAPTAFGNTFKLHSNPNANHTIYLDFNGYFKNSSVWEDGGSLTLGSYNSDGDPNSFSNTELEEMQLMWQRVAEDFAPFNINVTTEEPTDLGDLINTGGGDTRWGIRAVMTDNLNLDTGNPIINAGGGGTAYLDTFNSDFDEVALVFNGGAYAGGETISHEVGHTLGLDHDGQTPSTEYYGGHGTGETSWAPIMGAGFAEGVDDNVTQWTKASEYYNGNRTEDDLTIITTNNGFDYRIDDHGNINDTATGLASNNLNSFGIIERNTDIDIFSFNITTGTINFNIFPSSRALISDGLGGFTTEYLDSYGPNLDIWAGIYNSAGSLIAQSNPLDALSASFTDLFLSAGQYFLHIDGVGTGNPLSSTPTGYTDYGSLGQYSLSGTFLPQGANTISIDKTTDGTETGLTNTVFTITRGGDVSGALTVNYTLTGSATSGLDYAGDTIGTVNFAPDATTATIILPTIDDSDPDLDETIIASIETPLDYILVGSNTATATITDNDTLIFTNNTSIIIDSNGTNPYPSSINVSSVEGTISNIVVVLNSVSHTWAGDLDILLVGPTGATTILMSDIGEGTSIDGVTFNFDANALTPIDDTNVGVDGTYQPNNLVGLDETEGVIDPFPTPAPSGDHGTNLGTFFETDPNGIWSLYVVDDFPSEDDGFISGWSLIFEVQPIIPIINLSESQTVVEGFTNPQNVSYTVSLSSVTTETVIVEYFTANGSASDGLDYTQTSGILTFSPGEITKTIDIPILNDFLNEPDENFTLTLTNPANGTLGNAVSTTTITDTLSASVTTTLPPNVENLTLTGIGDINGTGNTGNNVILGNSGNNRLNGVDGNDTLIGLGGNDTLTGGIGNDSMIGGTENDTYYVDAIGDQVVESSSQGNDTVRSTITYTLGTNVEYLVLEGTGNINGTGNTLRNNITGNNLNNLLSGGEGNDTLNGRGGNDTLTGGIGNDSMIGGTGNDTYYVDATGDQVVELSNEGTDTVLSSITYTLETNVEDLILTGAGNINGTGNTLNNSIFGNDGNNNLVGGDGNDYVDGGVGNDTLNGGNGNDYIYDAGYGIGQNNLFGGDGNDTLTGGDGNDTLTGGDGNDSMIGGTGNDTYYVDATGDQVVELLSEGNDTVRSTITYTLGTNVEYLVLEGTGNINGTGNTLRNNITGNNLNNLLTGGEGNDTLNGRGGNDTLTGGIGNDSMIGGTGNDTFYVDATGDQVGENANEGTDTVRSTITYTLGANVENLVLEGTANINGTGNTLNNSLTGNNFNNLLTGGTGNDTLNGRGGDDTLTGGIGNDSMIGGTGNDTFYIDATGDQVGENANEGTDTVRSTITYTLGANVENLVLEGATNINGTGNTLNNSLTGNNLDNLLNGGTGNDTVNGRGGNDTLTGGIGNDSMIGGTGNDTFYVDATGDQVGENANEGTDTVRSTITYTLGANVENLVLEGATNINGTGNTLNNSLTGNNLDNTLTGGEGNDTLNGRGGNDTLTGGLGNDSLIGGTGADSFRFTTVNEGVDTITDFSVSDDTILVRRNGFGGGLSLGTLPLNQFRVGSSATASTDRFIYNSSSGAFFFDSDGNGATGAVQIATLSTGLAMTNQDIVVV
ncbi:alkaline phosphatase [Geminocystis sp. NIES-3709]|nr:alkaline phosphatase [Geminocystis sp. NIES-3709]